MQSHFVLLVAAKAWT